MWHDPTMYDPYRHGPPYLPGMGLGPSTVTARTKMASENLDLNVECANMISAYGSGAELSVLLAWLRAVSLIHQTHHWQTEGPTYYADHLLFERLYNESQDAIDSIAERAVGSSPSGGPNLVRPAIQASQIAQVVGLFYPNADPVGASAFPTISLSAEKHLLDVLQILRSRMEIAGRLSIGTDNLLQDIADKHEGFVYLLQQRAKVASKTAKVPFSDGQRVRVKDTHGHAAWRGDSGTIEKYVPFGKFYVQLDRNGRQFIDQGDLEAVKTASYMYDRRK